MDRKIIYLINPISGTRGKSSLQELITRRTQEKGIAFSILPTNAEGNYAFLIAHIEKDGITDIIVCGGDGTVNSVASALTGTNIRIGIIPMGSGNGLAFAAGIPKNPSRALDIIFAGQASFIDAFLINGQFSCMLCGIGFDAKVAHEFARQPKRGLQTYIKISLANFFRARPYKFRIGLSPSDGSGGDTGGTGVLPAGHTVFFPVEAFFINIANGDQFGNHVTIAPRASLDDGLLDIVIVKKTGKLRMLLSVIRQVLGGNAVQEIPVSWGVATPGKAGPRGFGGPGSGAHRDPGGKNILYFQTAELVIGNPEGAPLHIDGEPKETAEEFRIGVLPRVIRLIRHNPIAIRRNS
jgi:diacylglycerol kinase (ATP)